MGTRMHAIATPAGDGAPRRRAARSLAPALLLAGLIVLSSASVGVTADEKVVPQSRSDVERSFAPLVKRAAPAVVNVASRRTVRTVHRSPFLDDPFFRRFFGDALPFGNTNERLQSSLGSGVIVRPEGLIVTNHHVIKDSDQITVALADRREFPATVVLSDERTDLAVLEIDAGDELLPYLEFGDSDDLEVGDIVLAIGNPFGFGQTVTSGIVSALARTQVGVTDFRFFIQTDAAINPGNSGGALVNLDGKLVGVNTAIYSKSGGSVGIGFAIPANMVAVIVESARGGGSVHRPWLGASGEPVTAEIAQSIGLDRPGGVRVNGIYPGGPADRSGLVVGDVVQAVDGHDVADPAALAYRIATRRVGVTIELQVARDGARRVLEVQLAAPPETPPRSVTTLIGRHPVAGATVANLSPALADELGLDMLAHGVILLKVAGGSPAAQVGLKAGDIVLSVNGRTVGRVAALEIALEAADREWRLSVRRGRRVFQVAVRA